MKLSYAALAAVTAATVFHVSSAHAQEASPTATLHLANAPRDLVVERWDGDWQPVCIGTCDRALAIDATYRTRAPGARASQPFHLEGRPDDDVTIQYQGRSSAAYTAGVGLTITGVTFLGIGALASTGALIALADINNLGWGGLALAVIGGMVSGGCAVVGLATMLPGIYMMKHNDKSEVLHHDDELPRPVEPAFRDAHATAPAPSFTSIPLLSGTF
jgi:hypothetical protein